MTELDEELGPLVLEIINEFGADCVLTWITPGVYNTTTLKKENVPTTVNLKVAPPEEYSAYTAANSGGLIEFGDVKLLFAAQALPSKPPKLSVVKINPDTLDEETYTIMSSKGIKSGQLDCVYECVGRR